MRAETATASSVSARPTGSRTGRSLIPHDAAGAKLAEALRPQRPEGAEQRSEGQRRTRTEQARLERRHRPEHVAVSEGQEPEAVDVPRERRVAAEKQGQQESRGPAGGSAGRPADAGGISIVSGTGLSITAGPTLQGGRSSIGDREVDSRACPSIRTTTSSPCSASDSSWRRRSAPWRTPRPPA